MVSGVHTDCLGDRERARIELPGGAELPTSRRRRGCLRKPCERAVSELGRSFQVELMGERERALRVERDDLRVLLGALGACGFEPARVVVVYRAPFRL